MNGFRFEDEVISPMSKSIAQKVADLNYLKSLYQKIGDIDVESLVKETEDIGINTGFISLARQYPRIIEIDAQLNKIDQLKNQWQDIEDKVNAVE